MNKFFFNFEIFFYDQGWAMDRLKNKFFDVKTNEKKRIITKKKNRMKWNENFKFF